MKYRKRIIDSLLDLHLETFGATLIKGPKGCGKTTTGKKRAKTIIEFQDPDKRDGLIRTAENKPSMLLKGAKPILYDEWQDAPSVWGAIRKYIDDTGKVGQFILTGSTSQRVSTPHTGTLRISDLKMYTMSLFESGESNGTVSLESLFNEPESFDGCKSDLSIESLIFAICRGGWPVTLSRNTDKSRLFVVKNLFEEICSRDISSIDGVQRAPRIAKAILHSYSRNICTTASVKSILDDVNANFSLSEATLYSYIKALEELYIIEDIDAWCPQVRSKSAIRSGMKRNFTDPSIAVAALGVSPKYFEKDFKTLGFLFESLCIRDLKIYSTSLGGDVSFYHDRYGLEADCVLHLSDSRYALIEFKLGEREIDKGAEHLNEIEKLVEKYNESEKQCKLRKPDLKIVITATEYGYKRPDGVLVIPIGCLKD